MERKIERLLYGIKVKCTERERESGGNIIVKRNG